MKVTITIIVLCLIIGAFFIFSEIYSPISSDKEKIIFEVKQGESVAELAERLQKEGIIKNAWFFKKYLALKNLDTKINAGEFEIDKLSVSRLAKVISQPGISEETITIIPGWNLRQIAEYLVAKGFAKDTDEVYKISGYPAKIEVFGSGKTIKPDLIDKDLEAEISKPLGMSYEGWLAPDTYRVFRNSTIEEIFYKMLNQQINIINSGILEQAEKNSRINKLIDENRAPDHNILIMASILEREVKTPEDRRLVSDILWRRIAMGWAMQVDSSVHYAVDKSGTVFTTEQERQFDSPWNTYKYPGLPPGPICSPSADSIEAAANPTVNEYWYFLSGRDGKIHYAKTLDGHNANKKYL